MCIYSSGPCELEREREKEKKSSPNNARPADRPASLSVRPSLSCRVCVLGRKWSGKTGPCDCKKDARKERTVVICGRIKSSRYHLLIFIATYNIILYVCWQKDPRLYTFSSAKKRLEMTSRYLGKPLELHPSSLVFARYIPS